MTRRGTAARALAALVPGLLLAWPAVPARAQTSPDTLTYSVAIVPQLPHLTVEARMTLMHAGVLTLKAPPAAGPAETSVDGLSATDDRGRPLAVRSTDGAWAISVASAGAVRFRYRLSIRRGVTDGSTTSGLDSTHLYAVTRSLFVAPDPTAYVKSGRTYPVLSVHLVAPAGWRVVSGWAGGEGDYTPADGEDLLGSTLAAAADYRIYRGSAGGARWQLAIRGARYFADTTLAAVIRASLSGGAAMLGPVPQPLVSYTADVGRKGRTSGSLQGRSSIGLLWEPSEILERARAHDLFHETLHLWFGGSLEAERWWVEGVTDYVAARLLADWHQRPADLAELCFQSLRNYQTISHNTRMTMDEESRRGLGGDNTELLIYRKGMLAGLLIDAAIRRASNGQRTLDDVSRALLRLAATRHSHRVREAEIRDAVLAAGGPTVRPVWDRVVEGTALLTEDEVEGALATVTGRAFTPPPLAKGRKQLAR